MQLTKLEPDRETRRTWVSSALRWVLLVFLMAGAAFSAYSAIIAARTPDGDIGWLRDWMALRAVVNATPWLLAALALYLRAGASAWLMIPVALGQVHGMAPALLEPDLVESGMVMRLSPIGGLLLLEVVMLLGIFVVLIRAGEIRWP